MALVLVGIANNSHKQRTQLAYVVQKPPTYARVAHTSIPKPKRQPHIETTFYCVFFFGGGGGVTGVAGGNCHGTLTVYSTF